MKIAINCAFFLPKGGGIKEYIDNLVHNIDILDTSNEYILYVLSDAYEYAKHNLPSRFQLKKIPYSSTGKIKRSLFEQRFWIEEEAIEKFDIFHSPFFHSPTFKKAKVVMTVHDLRFTRYPQTYTFLRYCYLKYAVKKSVLNVNHIIAISSFTKDEIESIYNVPDDKITVIYESVNPDKFNLSNHTELPDFLKNTSYMLTVGHLEPRKNYDNLINAFEIIKKDKENEKLKLVIVGKKSHGYQSTMDKIIANKDIIYMDFVTDELLNSLYANATIFIFPSIYEGFGFPPLEAAILGTPSVVSNYSCIPEICGDSVLYFNPLDPNDIAIQCNKLLHDDSLRESLLKKSFVNLQRYSWEKNAKQTINVYNKVYEL